MDYTKPNDIWSEGKIMKLPVLQFYTASFHLLSPLIAVQGEDFRAEEILNEVVTFTVCKSSLDSRSVGCVGKPEQYKERESVNSSECCKLKE
jgi:hypothetical protein